MRIRSPATLAGVRVSRLVPPALDARRTALFNPLFARRAGGVVAMGGREYEFALAPRTKESAWGVTLVGKWGGADAAMFLEAAPALDWLAAAVSPELRGEDLRRLPPEMAVAAVEAVLEEPSSALAKATGSTAELKEVSFQPKQALSGEGFLAFTLVRRDDAQTARGTLALSGDLSAIAAGLAKKSNGGSAWSKELLAQVRVCLAIEVGRTSISLRELRTVEAGDVVVVDECPVRGPARELCVRLGRTHTARAALDGRKVVIRGEFMADKTESAPAPREKPAVAQAPAGAKAAKPPNLDELQVQLVLELDSQYVTVKELQALQPGFVLETGKGLESPISLKVNGRAVGKGELVELGGKVGVRVLEIGAV